MISIIHYISAKRRFKESKKTIMMMGGRDECSPMVLAQSEMIQLEMEYYREEMDNFIKYALLFAGVVLLCGVVYVVYESLKGIH